MTFTIFQVIQLIAGILAVSTVVAVVRWYLTEQAATDLERRMDRHAGCPAHIQLIQSDRPTRARPGNTSPGRPQAPPGRPAKRQACGPSRQQPSSSNVALPNRPTVSKEIKPMCATESNNQTGPGQASSPAENHGNQPIQHIRVGTLTVAIWETHGQFGPMYSCRLQRSFRDQSEQWQNTTSLGFRDMMNACKVIDLAHTWIIRRQNYLNAQAKQTQAAQVVPKADAVTIQAGDKALNVDVDVAAYIASLEAQRDQAYNKLETSIAASNGNGGNGNNAAAY